MALKRPSRWILIAIVSIAVISILFRFVAAAPVWMHDDENYYLNISQNFILRGELTPYMWRLGHTNIIAGSGTGYGLYLLVVWMKLVGLSLFNGRLLMIICSLCTAPIMYAVAYKWWESRTAGIVALIFTLVSTSPFYSFIIRMDAVAMLAYSIVLLIHISAVRSRSRWLHFATGVGLVVSVEFHVLGTLYIAALTVWYLIEYAQELITRRRLILNTGPVYFGVGGLIAGVIYIMVHIAPNPAAYFTIPSAYFQVLVLMKEVIRYARFMLLRPVEFVLLFFSVISALYRRRPEDRHFVVLIIVWMIVLYFAGFAPHTHYTYHLWPLLAVGTAGFIARGMRPQGQLTDGRLRLGLALAAVSLVFNIGSHIANLQPFELRRTIEITPTMAFIRANVPESTVVMGDVTDYYYLMDYVDFMSYRDSDKYGVAQRGETQLDYWRREQPLVIIGDDRGDDPELDQYMTEEEFQEVRPELWVAQSLLEKLAFDESGGLEAAT